MDNEAGDCAVGVVLLVVGFVLVTREEVDRNGFVRDVLEGEGDAQAATAGAAPELMKFNCGLRGHVGCFELALDDSASSRKIQTMQK